LLPKQVGINTRMQDHEWRAEARRESRLRFCDTSFSACYFRRVTRKEVIHRLFRRETRDWWQHAKSVGRQHDDVARIAGTTFRFDVAAGCERISRKRVLCLATVVEIYRASLFIVDNVLEDRSKHSGGAINIGLSFRRQLDHFRVATTFEVE